jgi:hypothetical protein
MALEQVSLPAVKPPTAETLEKVLIKGDLSSLTQTERLGYMKSVCDATGLNPLTQPFEYITLNGKLQLYAKKSATDQLRKIHGVSILELRAERMEDVYVVTAFARDREERTDAAKGAVTVGNLKGDALANALMKAETKAKRRVTLSICGLGVLDETELETIPASTKTTVTQIAMPKAVESEPSMTGYIERVEETDTPTFGEVVEADAVEAGDDERVMRGRKIAMLDKKARKGLPLYWQGLTMDGDSFLVQDEAVADLLDEAKRRGLTADLAYEVADAPSGKKVVVVRNAELHVTDGD